MNRKASIPNKLYIALTLLFMYLPMIVVVVYSFNSSRYNNFEGFSLKWYEELFQNRSIGQSLQNSLVLAFLSCGLAILIGTAGAVGMAKSKFRGQSLFENISLTPMMVPEIIMGMAFLVIFTTIKIPLGMLTLVIAHTSFCIPYVFVNVQSRLVGLDPAYVEAARDLGASPTRAFFDVTLPLIMPAVLNGALLAFAMSMDDVVISFFVTGTRSNTLPLQVYSMIKTGVSPEVNALCTLMLAAVFTAIALFSLVRALRNKRRGGQDTL